MPEQEHMQVRSEDCNRSLHAFVAWLRVVVTCELEFAESMVVLGASTLTKHRTTEGRMVSHGAKGEGACEMHVRSCANVPFVDLNAHCALVVRVCGEHLAFLKSAERSKSTDSGGD